MFISEIEVSNYRSIGQLQKLPLPKIGLSKCFFLLGMNESGKSNVLKAIGLLREDAKVEYGTDCQIEAEEKGEEILVWFKLGVDAPSFYQKQLEDKKFPKPIADAITFDEAWRAISISRDGREDYHSILLDKISPKLLAKYLVVSNTIVETNPELEEVNDKGEIRNALTAGRLGELASIALDSVLKHNTPKVIFWKSSPEYRITDRIDLDEFKNRPSSSIPLRNCFRIAGFSTDEKIRDRINAAVGNPSKTATLQQLLGEKVTEHINDVWAEHKVSVRFQIDGSTLSFLVEDQDNDIPKYQVEQRSDGFKHFISILLNLSAENKTQALANKIILLDEPETHLHPSGQRYLRDELLRIAKDNVVIIATHSIFMVDTKHLDRHFSVKKSNGSTQIVQIEQDNPYREEVLFEALGTSALQLIEPNVIVFEGKTDRDVYDLYVRKFRTDLKPPKVTAISGDGADEIIKYTKFLNTKLVKGYVVVDADQDGSRIKEKVLKEPGYNAKNTFDINDLLATEMNATLEDLFDSQILADAVEEQFGLAFTFEKGEPAVAQIKKALHDAKKPYRDAEKEKLKRAFFRRVAKLQKNKLKAQPYFKFVQALCKAVA